jgi:hypothetical protein
LLNLINDILDLSKIESGTVAVEAEEITFGSLRDVVERNFQHIAENKNLPFNINFDSALPRAFTTDPKRLQQIIKNLLSNAFKFTAHGHVAMSAKPVTQGWSLDHPVLQRSANVIALAISDTGIGIAPEKQRLIFEAFQQADAGTSRKYGGTGLGLAISAARRRNSPHERPGRGEHVYALPAAPLYRPGQLDDRSGHALGESNAPRQRGRAASASRGSGGEHRGRSRQRPGRRGGAPHRRG